MSALGTLPPPPSSLTTTWSWRYTSARPRALSCCQQCLCHPVDYYSRGIRADHPLCPHVHAYVITELVRRPRHSWHYEDEPEWRNGGCCGGRALLPPWQQVEGLQGGLSNVGLSIRSGLLQIVKKEISNLEMRRLVILREMVSCMHLGEQHPALPPLQAPSGAYW